MTQIQVSAGWRDSITGSGKATGYSSAYAGAQRHVVLTVGQTQIDVYVHGDDETRQLMKALASASGGLLATLPDEYGPLDERDESAVERERWPTVAEVAGEVYGGPSCGQAGCSPAWPCEVCQSLAGATGGEAR